MRTTRWRLVGVLLGLLGVGLVERLGAQPDLTTLLSMFLQQLYAGRMTVPGTGGTAAVPAVTFTVDTDTGLYWAGANTLGLSAGGAGLWTFSSTAMLAVTDNAIDIGAVGATRPKHIYAAGNYYGNGGTLTGITGATGGVSNTGSTTVASDSDNSGAEDIAFYTSTVARWLVKGGTGHLLPNVNATYDVGTSATMPRMVYANQFAGNGAASGNALFTANLVSGSAALKSVQAALETSDVSIIDLATTWNNAGNAPTAIKLNVLDSASNASSLLMDLQVGGVSRFAITKNGAISMPVGGVYFGVKGSLTVPSDGVFTLLDNAGTSFGRLQFGGTTNQFPALGRNGTNLAALLGDGSDYTYFITYGIQLASFGSIKMVGVDGIIGLFNNAGTSFNRLVFGGTTDSFPALLRDTTDLSIVGGAAGVVNSSLIIPGQKATSGQRYVCITTTGRLVSSAAACSGT